MKALIDKIRNKYPELRLKEGKKFAFRPPKTIIIGPKEPGSKLLLLHELGHATIEHKNYKMDIERLKIETEAWEQAERLAQEFGVPFDAAFAQNELDSYRDWIHQKSLCKTCRLTRFQTKDGKYHCPRCDS